MPASLQDFVRVAPEEFLRKLRKLWSSQLRELRKIVGSPIDVSKVKASHWAKWKNEQDAALLILMVGSSMLNLRTQVSDWRKKLPDEVNNAEIEKEFLRNIRRRSKFASERITETTRNRLETVETLNDLDTLFSESRSQTVTTTESTAAQSAGVHAVYNSFRRRRIPCQLVWSMRPCNHCEVCPMLDRTSYDFWSQFTNGPPIHPNCCCQLIILLGTRAQLLRSGQMNPNPSVTQVRAAMRRNGFRIRPTP